jgi:hypothetical protein
MLGKYNAEIADVWIDKIPAVGMIRAWLSTSIATN